MLKFFEFLFNLFRPAQPVQPKPPADNLTEPAQISHSKVLALVYNPLMDSSGTTLQQKMNWYNVNDLISGFIADLLEVSGGMARYQIVERVDLNEFPLKTDGYRYTPQEYLRVWQSASAPHMPQEADYYAILNQFQILQRVARNEIDEVWIFGFPHAGFYESIMAGPGAFWCNAPALANTAASKRRFVVMGFSYERYLGEMLESYGHRAESIMEKTFARVSAEKNLWKRFTRYEKIAPGKAACGNIHFAPNSQRDYEWANPAAVLSECYDWKNNFPNFKGDVRSVTAAEWGGGDMRAHHQWWLDHFPRIAGRTNGVHNNWWQYVVHPQNVTV
ncbi:MAG: hypothetical protein Fur002_02930 [Anaerolineales bacterium]